MYNNCSDDGDNAGDIDDDDDDGDEGDNNDCYNVYKDILVSTTDYSSLIVLSFHQFPRFHTILRVLFFSKTQPRYNPLNLLLQFVKIRCIIVKINKPPRIS